MLSESADSYKHGSKLPQEAAASAQHRGAHEQVSKHQA